MEEHQKAVTEKNVASTHLLIL